jgi:hypothetical protein
MASAPETNSGKALKHCLEASLDRQAAEELHARTLSLGKDLPQCLSGLAGAVDRFQSPLVNAYSPDICFEDVLERNRIVYVQLPSNLFKLQAPVLGKVMLMDLQQDASLRQVFRTKRNQRAFSVCVDEFGTFADMSIIDSLNKLRDAYIRGGPPRLQGWAPRPVDTGRSQAFRSQGRGEAALASFSLMSVVTRELEASPSEDARNRATDGQVKTGHQRRDVHRL